MTASERLIVALDMPTVEGAIELVDALDNVSFFKVGWRLYVTGQVGRLLERLKGRNVFLDLKLPADIGNTIANVIEQCLAMNVQFLTLSDSISAAAVDAAKKARKGSATPKFLIVPVLSSMDESDLKPGAGSSVNDYIVSRGAEALGLGCDGLIVSGSAIKACRSRFPAALLVSPGIRPAGSSTDDHKRSVTPGEAIRDGADYLVVGRPIIEAADPRLAAERLVEEIRLAAEAAPRSR
jgi:orotidine-5'-phosphate decarboxylase